MPMGGSYFAADNLFENASYHIASIAIELQQPLGHDGRRIKL